MRSAVFSCEMGRSLRVQPPKECLELCGTYVCVFKTQYKSYILAKVDPFIVFEWYRVPHLKLYNSRSLFFHLINNFLKFQIRFHILQTWKFYDISSFFDLRKVVFHKSDFFQKNFFSKIFFIFSKKFFFEIFSLQW